MFHCIFHSEYDTLIQETVDVTLAWDDDKQIEAHNRKRKGGESSKNLFIVRSKNNKIKSTLRSS